jgi:uncharacterized membrane protein
LSKSTDKKQPKKSAPPTNHIISQSSIIQHAGPIPHPETMARYSQIIENGAERIMRMAEEEQKHRHKVEEKAIQAEIESEQQSQKLATKAQ